MSGASETLADILRRIEEKAAEGDERRLLCKVIRALHGQRDTWAMSTHAKMDAEYVREILKREDAELDALINGGE